MNYIKDIDTFQAEKDSVVTLGKFDGVHRGHRKLISRVLEIAEVQGLEPAVFTFDVSPQAALGIRERGLLMTNEERSRFLEELGIRLLVECHFSALRDMEAEAFVQSVLAGKMRARHFVVGPDFRFGKGRRGTPEFLKDMGKSLGFQVDILEKEMDRGREIASSYIREELLEGRIEKVNELLGYPYFITGEVIHGRHLGHKLGFPTINQVPPEEKILPPRGVYASRIHVEGGVYRGVSNLGCKPTVHGEYEGLETYLFQCDRDLYGKTAKVELLRFLRPERKFPSVEDLKEQLKCDVKAAEQIF